MGSWVSLDNKFQIAYNVKMSNDKKNNAASEKDRGLFRAGSDSTDICQFNKTSEQHKIIAGYYSDNFQYSYAKHIEINNMINNDDLDGIHNKFVYECQNSNQTIEDLLNKHLNAYVKHLVNCLVQMNHKRFEVLCADHKEELRWLTKEHSGIHYNQLIPLARRVRDEQDKFLLACKNVQYKPLNVFGYDTVLEILEKFLNQSYDLLLQTQQQELCVLSVHHNAQKNRLHIAEYQKQDLQDLEKEHQNIRQDFIEKCDQLKVILHKFYESYKS